MCQRNFLIIMSLLTIILPLTFQTSFALEKSDITVHADYNGDGKAEKAIWRPSNGTWYIFSNKQLQIVQWGANGDIPIPADYDGDGADEICVWRPSNGNWYISLANRSWSQKGSDYKVEQWGTRGDIPVPADYDGDDADEICVWRPSNGNWYISLANRSWQNKGNDYQVEQWGTNGDIPIPADYDGDGADEICVWRPSNGNWYISLANRSWSNRGKEFQVVKWGNYSFTPVPADYKGDGITDIAIMLYTTGKWYIYGNILMP